MRNSMKENGVNDSKTIVRGKEQGEDDGDDDKITKYF